jgi:hypothetical protein
LWQRGLVGMMFCESCRPVEGSADVRSQTAQSGGVDVRSAHVADSVDARGHSTAGAVDHRHRVSQNGGTGGSGHVALLERLI